MREERDTITQEIPRIEIFCSLGSKEMVSEKGHLSCGGAGLVGYGELSA